MLKVNIPRYQSSVIVRLDRTHSKKKYLSRIGFLPFDGVCLVPDKVPGAGADFKVRVTKKGHPLFCEGGGSSAASTCFREDSVCFAHSDPSNRHR